MWVGVRAKKERERKNERERERQRERERMCVRYVGFKEQVFLTLFEAT